MKAAWPELYFEKAQATYETLHLWTQIVGKIRLVKTPWINHSWHVTLYVTPTGLTTSDIVDVNNHFQINFDFHKHQLLIKQVRAKSDLLIYRSCRWPAVMRRYLAH